MKLIIRMSFVTIFFTLSVQAKDPILVRWWDCTFKRPAVTDILNSGESLKAEEVSVNFAIEQPTLENPSGEDKEYFPRIDGGKLVVTVTHEKIKTNIREEIFGPVNWPHSHMMEKNAWKGLEPIDIHFERSLVKATIKYHMQCLARK